MKFLMEDRLLRVSVFSSPVIGKKIIAAYKCCLDSHCISLL